jgi:hypothetical protein
MIVKFFGAAPGGLLTFAAASGLAGVVVTQNILPGAASWPGSPIIETAANPAGQTSVCQTMANAINLNLFTQ